MTKWSVVAEILRPVVVVAVVVVNCRRNEDGKTTSFVLNAAGFWGSTGFGQPTSLATIPHSLRISNQIT